jgi:hypothetical protein
VSSIIHPSSLKSGKCFGVIKISTYRQSMRLSRTGQKTIYTVGVLVSLVCVPVLVSDLISLLVSVVLIPGTDSDGGSTDERETCATPAEGAPLEDSSSVNETFSVMTDEPSCGVAEYGGGGS